MVPCFAVINNVPASILKTINGARTEFSRKHIGKMEVVVRLDGDLKITFNLQYGKVLSIVFCFCFLISNNVLTRNWKKETFRNFFFGTIQIFWCLINTLSKYIFMQRSTKF